MTGVSPSFKNIIVLQHPIKMLHACKSAMHDTFQRFNTRITCAHSIVSPPFKTLSADQQMYAGVLLCQAVNHMSALDVQVVEASYMNMYVAVGSKNKIVRQDH